MSIYDQVRDHEVDGWPTTDRTLTRSFGTSILTRVFTSLLVHWLFQRILYNNQGATIYLLTNAMENANITAPRLRAR